MCRTDVIMQSMNGKELSDAMKQRRPGVRTIFISGYTDNIIPQKGVLEPGVVILRKPLTQRLLAGSIREVIDGKGQEKQGCSGQTEQE